MYAIVKIGGKQYKVQKDTFLYTNRLAHEVGAEVSFTDVLLLDDAGKVSVGTPYLKGAKVNATVLEHAQADKVLVFKKKRRKDYKKSYGHRQPVTKIKINSIHV